MNEEEFAHSIDCCFPYFDESEWKHAIDTGISISTDSAFMALHEICRPPKSSTVTPRQLKRMASYWVEQFSHPLSKRLYEIALKMIDRQDLPVTEVLSHFEEIRKFQNEYNALAIAYFSCDDAEGRIEGPYNEIVHFWQSSNV